MSDEQDCFVYIIAKRDGDRIVAPVKVGISANVGIRMTQFQTACPFPIVLVHTLRVPTRWMAREIESCFHYTQRDHKAHGEWFDLSPSDALATLLTQFRLHLEMNEVSETIREPVIELCGAGETGMSVLRRLREQDAEEGQ